MANPNDVKAAIVAQEKQPKSLIALINESVNELSRVVPNTMDAERLTRIALTCIRLTPKLAQCTQESFLGALFTSAQVGIEPVAGRACILPYYNSKKNPDGTWHKVLEAQFMLMYRGIVELFYRHVKAVQLDWGVVREGDDFDFEYGTAPHLTHRPKFDTKAPAVAVYVVATLTGGGKPFKVMSFEDCMEHGRAHSKTYDSKTGTFYKDSPWSTDPESMCLKTVLIQLAKLLPLSVELQQAINADESSRDYRDALREGLNSPSTTNWKETPAIESGDEPPPETSKGHEPEIPFGK